MRLWCGARGAAPSPRGGARNSSSMPTARGLRARGLSAPSTRSGISTVRVQYDIFDRWNGNQPGSSEISTGMTGTASQGTMPYIASRMRVNTLPASAPPRARMAVRARTMCGASGESPIIFSAKYALTLALGS
jgi:hypothetical protein